MSWAVHDDDADAPVWAGEDSAFDKYASKERANRLGLLGGIISIALLMFGLMVFVRGGGLDMMAGLVIMLGSVAWFAVKSYSPGPTRFLGRQWVLEVQGDRLAYIAQHAPGDIQLWPSEEWSLRIDDIARVESGLTKEWQAVRHYRPEQKHHHLDAIPDVEYQTFLFLSDGSRRVLYTANAAREATATFAHSVRSWLERQRNAAKARDTSPDHQIGEGFDL